jgi:hypothetical protein
MMKYLRDLLSKTAKKEGQKLFCKAKEKVKEELEKTMNCPNAFDEQQFQALSVYASRYNDELSQWKSVKHTELQRNNMIQIRNLNGLMGHLGVEKILASCGQSGDIMSELRNKMNYFGFQDVITSMGRTIDNPGSDFTKHILPYLVGNDEINETESWIKYVCDYHRKALRNPTTSTAVATKGLELTDSICWLRVNKQGNMVQFCGVSVTCGVIKAFKTKTFPTYQTKVKSVQVGVISATCDVMSLLDRLQKEKGGPLSADEMENVVRESFASTSSASAFSTASSERSPPAGPKNGKPLMFIIFGALFVLALLFLTM